MTDKIRRPGSKLELARESNYAPKTLDNLRSQKKLFPYYKVGGHIVYDLDECAEIVASKRVEVD